MSGRLRCFRKTFHVIWILYLSVVLAIAIANFTTGLDKASLGEFRGARLGPTGAGPRALA